MSNKKDPIVLDCTLRDGGYYNNWDFSEELIKDYTQSISKIGIKYVELGFRSKKSRKFMGPAWHTTDLYLDNLNVPKNLKLGVMINASELPNNRSEILKFIKENFKIKKKSKLHFVRIAMHDHEVDKSITACQHLKKLGYFVGLNLMQISKISFKKIDIISQKMQKINLDVFYLADSLGALNPSDLSKIINNVKKFYKKPMGIHAHNNMSMAVKNTMTAYNEGVDWLDCTILGMGRGPGNAQTEYLINEIATLKREKKNILPILTLIEKHFLDLFKKYNWGTNTFYYLAGLNSIHPTYIQEMIQTKFKSNEILEAINLLKDTDASKYNPDLIRSEFQKTINLKKGTWNPSKVIKSKDVILIASGKKSEQYIKHLESYIKIKKPYVIAVNPDVKINNK